METAPALYDNEGFLTPERLRAITFNCMHQRPADLAAVQDKMAISSPVGIRFIDSNPSGFYVVNSEGEQVPICRLEIALEY